MSTHSSAKSCETQVKRTRNKTLGYMSIPVIGLLILLLLIWIPSLTGLSLFGNPNQNKSCNTGLNLSINSTFYVTVYNETDIYEDANESYYIGGLELAIITLDPILADFINKNPTNWSNIIDATNFTSYIELSIIFPFTSKDFNITALSFLFDEGNYDGSSVSIKQSPSFILAGMGGIIMRGDGQDFESVDIGFVNESIFSQNDDFTNYMKNNKFTIFECADGYLDLDIRGMWFNTTADDFDLIDLTVDGTEIQMDNTGMVFTV